MAIRTLGRLASRVYLPPGIRLRGVGASATRHLGLPVRQEIVRMPRAEARVALGLDPSQKVLSVLGGSQGASTLNDWARESATALAAEGVQLYCLTGLGKGEPEIREHRSRSGAIVRSIFVPFSDRMAELLSASDLTVSRAGSGTLAELIRCETPAILVPYPHAADDHQRSNARFFERQGGGLVVESDRIASMRAEVLDAIFNEWLLRKFRANLKRMDRANSLPLMIQDLERLGGAPASPRPPAFAPA
jgi:UDP-N-acetylglucosamine--N-acetylmuramyl-(pentapeptide) pyrophosphoryl-undecaprenol N-acetylglucosamine transferase